MPLFLAEEKINYCSVKVPVLANLVLQVALVGVLDPLRQVAEEDERGHVGALSMVMYLILIYFPLTAGGG